MNLTCIVCPVGCRLAAALDGGAVTVTGNRCPRGAEFARTELTAPRRTVTTTVRTAFPSVPVLPVRTDGEIAKGQIPALMRFLAGVTVARPVAVGDVIVENVLGAGCNLIATDTTAGRLPEPNEREENCGGTSV